MPDTATMTSDQRRRLAAAEAAARMLRASLFNGSSPKTSQILDLAEWILYGGLAEEINDEQEALAAVDVAQAKKK